MASSQDLFRLGIIHSSKLDRARKTKRVGFSVPAYTGISRSRELWGEQTIRLVADSVMTITRRPSLSARPKSLKMICCFVCLLFLLQQSPSCKGIPTEELHRVAASTTASGHMSIDNMTCKVFKQPLNHFVPRGWSPFYEESYCTYYGFASSRGEDTNHPTEKSAKDEEDNSPIFFYTGNESPLEQYINQVCRWSCSFLLRKKMAKSLYCATLPSNLQCSFPTFFRFWLFENDRN